MVVYEAKFSNGSSVRITGRAFLENFLKTWKFHHKLDLDQLNYAGHVADVESVGFYHGGDVLYQLKGIPGIWHEKCLESNYGQAVLVPLLSLGKHTLELSQPLVMGVLNRTPDSFSDGGEFTDFNVALRHAEQMAQDGAAIIDIGGESTRPGAQAVSVEQELERVVPLIERLRDEIDIPISVDTSKPEVMRAAVAAGAGMINDVCALRQPGALETAAQLGVPVVLMHMQGEPHTMQKNPHYANVVVEVKQFLEDRVRACETLGIPRKNILIDPGFGFGKTLGHNLELLRKLREFTTLGLPVVVGLSRKSSIGTLLGGVPASERLHGSVAAAVVAVLNGAHMVRTHDVKPTVEALKVAAAVLAGE